MTNFSNVTGWNQLMTGHPVQATFLALNEPLWGMLVFIIYFILSLVIWSRTQSIEFCLMISMVFFGVMGANYLAGGTQYFNSLTYGLTLLIIAFEMGATIFKFIAKESNK